MRKFLFTAMILLSGLTVCSSEHPMDSMIKTWVNFPVKDVIEEWGDPTDINYLRGQREYIWITTGTRFIPGTMFEERTSCQRKLIVGKKGKIIYGTYSGNGCPFTKESVKKWNNPNYDYLQDMFEN